MGTTTDKLQYLIDAKSAISAAIEAKGGTVPTELSGYGPAIEALPSGGSNEIAIKIVDRTITDLTAEDLSGCTVFGDRVFFGCSALSSVVVPSTVTTIAAHALRECTALTAFTVPNTVTELGAYAFYNCSGLTSLTLPENITTLNNYLVYGCSSLTSITIPNSVTSIGTNVFQQSTNLENIYFGTDRTTIPTLANYNSFSNLKSTYKIYVPSSLLNTWKTTSPWSSIASHIVAYT